MSRIRSLASSLLAGLLLAVPAAASAHTELSAADPAGGAALTEPPSAVVLTFTGEIDEDAAFTVTGPAGDEVGTGTLDLDVADRNVLRGEVTVEEPGEYVVSYMVTGEDGHPVSGELSFVFEPDGRPSPNTALRATAPPPITGVLGATLLLAAVVLAGRKAVRR